MTDCERLGETNYYWYHENLQISTEMTASSGLLWHLCLVLLFAWVIVFAVMMKGLAAAGKVRRVVVSLDLSFSRKLSSVINNIKKPCTPFKKICANALLCENLLFSLCFELDFHTVPFSLYNIHEKF